MTAKKKFKKSASTGAQKELVVLQAKTASKSSNKLIFSGYISAVFLLFLIAVAVLIYTPKVVKLTESQLIISSNQIQNAPKPLISEVKGLEITPPIAIESQGLEAPKFSAAAVFAQDLNTGQILYQKNIDKKLSPASTTKIMTALIAVKYYKPADILKVSGEGLVAGSSMGLKLGEQLTFRGLLYGMLLNSGNDAAFTIASNYPGGVSTFVEAMNKRAKELGLENTNFQNPAGFDGPNHYSSAADLAKIAKEAIQDPQITKIVSTKETSVTAYIESTDAAMPVKNNTHLLKNLNQLLGQDGVIGVKTGYTETAGENFVGLVERDNRKILTVVLSSNDRFGESKALMDWVYNNYSWKSN